MHALDYLLDLKKSNKKKTALEVVSAEFCTKFKLNLLKAIEHGVGL